MVFMDSNIPYLLLRSVEARPTLSDQAGSALCTNSRGVFGELYAEASCIRNTTCVAGVGACTLFCLPHQMINSHLRFYLYWTRR